MLNRYFHIPLVPYLPLTRRQFAIVRFLAIQEQATKRDIRQQCFRGWRGITLRRILYCLEYYEWIGKVEGTSIYYVLDEGRKKLATTEEILSGERQRELESLRDIKVLGMDDWLEEEQNDANNSKVEFVWPPDEVPGLQKRFGRSRIKLVYGRRDVSWLY